jgi:hypothetical protein
MCSRGLVQSPEKGIAFGRYDVASNLWNCFGLALRGRAGNRPATLARNPSTHRPGRRLCRSNNAS